MKFITVVVAALAGTTFAAPYKRSLIGEVSGILGGVTGGTGVEGLESELQGALGGTLAKVEQALGGVPLANKLMELVHSGVKPMATQAIGEALVMVQQGVPINTVNSYLNSVTGGTVSDLEQTLGTSDLVGILGGVTNMANGVTNNIL
ncbi:hypothetical protein QQS21_007935 [Conoideocrella luteorostrata]|uniref:Uncharacterized protein n=1 Tax=Conoideocrella luteorostrata TaxID=1105319 RepID=A0AAJ0FZ34_9HYPO|nr:hypothetical protein QQS21_007935 [Conoideocrella luteorostrata]